MIKFLLNREVVHLPESMATVTALDYLRNHKGRSGTKEGCASGDCGACTVVLADVTPEGLRYQAINSCITLLGALHGRQVITVEDLAEGQQFHPVQQAMVDYHGSQCGFCTPGFVMALFALYKNSALYKNDKADGQAESTGKDTQQHQRRRQDVLRGLSGNLCRCTGYRPIIDAALSCLDQQGADRFVAEEPAVITALQTINQSASGLACLPRTVPQLASAYLAHPDAWLVAGSTDLGLEITQQLDTPDHAIFFNRVDELRVIEEKNAQLVVGAAASLSAFDDVAREYFPPISELLERFGSPQIRNQATIGGNLATASPIGDLPPVLLALGAVLDLRKGERVRSVTIDGFFTGYRKTVLEKAEFIQRIRVPLLTGRQVLRIYKVSKRRDDDISSVCLGICMTLKDDSASRDQYAGATIDNIRIAFGGMAATPKRALTCEAAFAGHDFTSDTIRRAQAAINHEFEPISDVRASAGYRTEVAQNLLQRFYLELTRPDLALRVEDAA